MFIININNKKKKNIQLYFKAPFMTPKVALQFIKQSRVKNSKNCMANSMNKTRHKTQIGGGKNSSEETQVGGGEQQ
jgi:hypothetical protein